MKKSISIIHLIFSSLILKAQVDDESKEEGFREEVRLELIENYSGCALFGTEKAISKLNGKIEIWSVCRLDNGNRFISIESYQDETFFQEIYFDKSGKLRYAKEIENYTPKNGFAQMKWNCEFFFQNEELKTLISLGHGKTESESWDPEVIVEMFKKRLSELEQLKNQ
ncbi:MAG: hypothetical protein WBG46_06020 [Nonlabens sp.]